MITDVAGLIQAESQMIEVIWDAEITPVFNAFQANPTPANAIIGLEVMDTAMHQIWPFLLDAMLLQGLTPNQIATALVPAQIPL